MDDPRQLARELGASAHYDQGEAFLVLATAGETVAIKVRDLDYAARLAHAINRVEAIKEETNAQLN